MAVAASTAPLPLHGLPRARFLREWASTARPAKWPAPPEGRNRPAMLIPGFLAGDASLSRMARWLRDGGFSMARGGVTWNVACMEDTLGHVERRLEAAVQGTGLRALLVGQSRGGTLGRVLSARRPDLVETLVTLGSPVLNQLAVKPRVWLPIGAVGLLGTAGVPGLFSLSCMRGDCCTRANADLAAPFPKDVDYLAVFSRNDEVVRWEACVEPAATPIEVATSHVGMGVDVDVWRRLRERL